MGKGAKTPKVRHPKLTAEGKKQQGIIYSHAMQALGGGGIEDWRTQNIMRRDAIHGLEEAYDNYIPLLNSWLHRTVASEDDKTKSFIADTARQAKDVAMEQIDTSFAEQRATDRAIGRSIMTDAVAGAKRLGAQTLNAWNTANLQTNAMQQQAVGNIGSGMMDLGASMMAANRYYQNTAGPKAVNATGLGSVFNSWMYNPVVPPSPSGQISPLSPQQNPFSYQSILKLQ